MRRGCLGCGKPKVGLPGWVFWLARVGATVKAGSTRVATDAGEIERRLMRVTGLAAAEREVGKAMDSALHLFGRTAGGEDVRMDKASLKVYLTQRGLYPRPLDDRHLDWTRVFCHSPARILVYMENPYRRSTYQRRMTARPRMCTGTSTGRSGASTRTATAW